MPESSVIPFLFEGEALIRIVTAEDEPWLVAADICRVLGVKNPTQAVGMLDEDERAMFNIGPQGSVNIISEGGFYTLTLRSRQATTPGTVQHRFRKWVTSEVLPSIRKTGKYEAPQQIIPPAQEQVQDTALNLRIVTETRQSFGCKASQQMWFKLGLPVVSAMFEPSNQLTIPFPREAA